MASTIAQRRSRQLVVRRDSPADAALFGHADTYLYRSLQPRPEAAREVRASLSELLVKNAVDNAATSAALLCIEEALTNAISHASDRRARIGVSVQIDHGDLRIEVRDRGVGFDLSGRDLAAKPDLESEHGRGLFLMQQLLEDLQITSDSRGTTVRMTLHLW